MKLVLVAALARHRAIGRGNALLWHEPRDQRHFREVTTGAPVVMGRRTWDSLPPRFRPLPGRRNVVLTRDAQWRADGAERAASLDEALALLESADRVSVIGGGDVYAQALPRADELLLTEVDADFADADTYFPAFEGEFVEVAREAHTSDAGVRFDFVTYRRR